jgi:hypothetical protein
MALSRTRVVGAATAGAVGATAPGAGVSGTLASCGSVDVYRAVCARQNSWISAPGSWRDQCRIVEFSCCWATINALIRAAWSSSGDPAPVPQRACRLVHCGVLGLRIGDCGC